MVSKVSDAVVTSSGVWWYVPGDSSKAFSQEHAGVVPWEPRIYERHYTINNHHSVKHLLSCHTNNREDMLSFITWMTSGGSKVEVREEGSCYKYVCTKLRSKLLYQSAWPQPFGVGTSSSKLYVARNWSPHPSPPSLSISLPIDVVYTMNQFNPPLLIFPSEATNSLYLKKKGYGTLYTHVLTV